MTQPDTQARALAKVDEAVKYVERRRSESFQRLNSTSSGDWEFHLKPLRALRKAIERHGDDGDGYCKGCSCLFDHDPNGNALWEPFPCLELTEIAKELNIEII